MKHARGYEGLKKSLTLKPNDIIEQVKASGLRGRGGAGFPTGLKWSFIPKDTPKPKYLACNADESEPGTFKDRVLMERNPHLLHRGCVDRLLRHRREASPTSTSAASSTTSQETLERAIDEAYKAGFLGKNILGTGFRLRRLRAPRRRRVHLRRRDRAARIARRQARHSRASSRRFPLSPASIGARRSVNNVETLCNVPLIVLNGPEWFAKLGPEKNGGPKLFCISGHVKRPGVYEASMNTTLRDLIFGDQYAQGMKDGRKFKAIIPGGSSVPILLEQHLDTPASFDHIQKAGSLLGSAGLIIMDDSVCMVWLAMNLLHFYRHESCGKCTPCREGGDWLYKLLQRVERGEGQMKDIDLLYGIANNIVGKTLCAFGDAAATPVLTTINLFRDEFEAHVREGRCTLPAPWRARHAMVAAH